MFKPLRDPNCQLCPLHENAGFVCVTEYPTSQPKWLICGEAPGFNESQLGIPFVGRSGELLNNTLEAVGLNRSDFYVRNTINCRPPDNRKPQEDEIQVCSSTYLIPEFKSLRPELVVLLGNTALQTFTNRAGITRNRGFIPWPDHLFLIGPDEGDEQPHIPDVFCTIHPSAALRSTASREAFEEDFAQLALDISKRTRTPITPIQN